MDSDFALSGRLLYLAFGAAFLALVAVAVAVANLTGHLPLAANAVKLRRSMSLAVKSLWLHKLRSFLSVLGIIIGTCSVISLMSFGEGSMQDRAGRHQAPGRHEHHRPQRQAAGRVVHFFERIRHDVRVDPRRPDAVLHVRRYG